ncbi:hypothetical protein BR93DRAFT_942746 [Coniochaeta sp. PMI_546]|nr:hypothetical protein BR93DRAFT_942746 [Coniochaeta sp. PMI_546]
MPRQLPWKVNGGSRPPTPRNRTTASPSLPAVGPAAVDQAETRSASRPKSGTSTPIGGKSRRSLTARPDRSPSTSPPPEPISEEFMIEGFDHDDRYRMVEDEFLAMANDFTKHLHAAEYHRLKALASTRNADMIRTISRPVTGRMTDLVKKRRNALELATAQRKGLRNALGKRKGRQDDSDSDDDDDELPWAGTSLQGLMESPRKTAAPLPVGSSSLGHGERVPTTRPKLAETTNLGISGSASRIVTRPSSSHMETTTDEDDDDLDTQPRFPGLRDKIKRSESSTLSLNQKAASIEAMSRRREPAYSTTRSELPRNMPAVKVAEKPVAQPSGGSLSDLDEDDEGFKSRVQSRRAQQKTRLRGSGTEDNKRARHNSAVDAIPLI